MRATCIGCCLVVWIYPLALGTSADVLIWGGKGPQWAKGHLKDDEVGAHCIVFLIVRCLWEGEVFIQFSGQSICSLWGPFWKGVKVRTFQLYSPQKSCAVCMRGASAPPCLVCSLLDHLMSTRGWHGWIAWMGLHSEAQKFPLPEGCQKTIPKYGKIWKMGGNG